MLPLKTIYIYIYHINELGLKPITPTDYMTYYYTKQNLFCRASRYTASGPALLHSGKGSFTDHHIELHSRSIVFSEIFFFAQLNIYCVFLMLDNDSLLIIN